MIQQEYFRFRFGRLVHDHLARIGKGIPMVAEIVSVTLDDLGAAVKDACGCGKGHFVRYLLNMTLADGQVIRAGTQCLGGLGYPLSLIRNLDGARRTVHNDIAEVKPIDPQSVDLYVDSCNAKAQAIVDSQYLPGLVFLGDYGRFINGFLGENLTMPPWLAAVFSQLARESAVNASTAKQVVAAQRRDEYRELEAFLTKLDDKICSRSESVRKVLTSIRAGEVVQPSTQRMVQKMKEKFDDALAERTEKAFPFLFALVSGKISLSRYDQAAVGQESILVSLYRQVQNGWILSEKQLEILAKKYQYYGQKFQHLTEIERKTSGELLHEHSTLRERLELMGDSTVGAQLRQIAEALRERGVNV